MSDLPTIRRVLSRQAAEIADVPRVLRDMEERIQRYAQELEVRLPELDEYFRLAALPFDERDKALPMGSPAQRAYQEAYRLLLRLKIFPKDSFARLVNMGLNGVFLALLQKYEIPAALRKKVEAAAKVWAKTRVQDPKKGLELETFKKLMQMYREHAALIRTVMAQGVDRSTATPDQVKTWTAGPFRLLNTGGFDDKTMEDCVQVVEKAVQHLKSKGLSKVCYGDIMISNTVGRSSKILAFYLPSKDEMFVRANLKNVKSDAVHTVLHELAHRLQFKFLSGKRREINTMYQVIARNSRNADQDKLKAILDNPEIKPKPGDTIVDPKKGLVFEVDQVVYDTVHVHLVEEPKVKAKVSLLGYMQMKGIKVDVPNRSGFITHYAGTDADENFAEMVAAYCLGDLPPEQVEMLEPLL